MKSTPLQHGEIILLPVNETPAGKVTRHTSFIVAHSETGHHHVLESKHAFEVIEDDREQLYIRLFEPAKLVHQKTVDFHPTLSAVPGIYKLYNKTEFDLWEDVIREVRD